MNHAKLSKIFIVISWAAFVFTMIGLPMPTSAVEKSLPLADKAVHIFLFGILSWLIIWAIKDSSKLIRYGHRISFLISFIFAIIGEYYQAFVPGRRPDMFDLLAGVAGICMAIMIDSIIRMKSKPKLLLHICCIGCGAYVSQSLKDKFDITLFFYNPNIFPQEEYVKRLEETKRVAKKFGLKIVEGKNDHKKWLEMSKGHEADKERGERCVMCYRDRLEAVAKLAGEKYFKYFTTTLTISPHKDAKAVSMIGQEMQKKYGVEFLDRDFKKKDGFRLSTILSRELGLYRQDYCGCEFSRAYSKCDICG